MKKCLYKNNLIQWGRKLYETAFQISLLFKNLTNMEQRIVSCFTDNAIHHLRNDYSYKVGGLRCSL